MIEIGLYDIVKSTTPESNKSLSQKPFDYFTPSTPKRFGRGVVDTDPLVPP
jgi:hypothetical protein